MKKKFNAYCLAMLVALAAVLVLPSLVTLSSGFMDGWSSEDKQPGYHPVHNSTSMVQMMPRKAMFPDSIHNMTSGDFEDMMVMSAVIRSKTEPSMSDPSLYRRMSRNRCSNGNAWHFLGGNARQDCYIHKPQPVV